MDGIIEWLLGAIESVDPALLVLLAGVGIMLETSVFVGLIVPGDTVVLVASTGIQDARMWAAMLVSVLIGSLLGESIGFALGRYLGPKLIQSRLGHKIGKENWEKASLYLVRRGGPAIFFSRFLPLLHSLVPFLVGMSQLSYRRFLAWTAPACLIWASAYTTVGWLAAGTFRELKSQLSGAGYIFVAAIALFLVIVWLVKRRILKGEARYFGSG